MTSEMRTDHHICDLAHPEVRGIQALVISDLHYRMDRIQQIAQYLKVRNERVDVIFSPGDFCNLAPKENNGDHPQVMVRAEEELKQMLSALEMIFPKVLYVPGNHDPFSLFASPSPSYSSNSLNLHKRFLRLGASSLVVAGLGGSVPALREGQIRWEGDDQHISFPLMAQSASDNLSFSPTSSQRLSICTAE